MNIRSLVKKEVRSLTAYSAKEIPCRIKLDANEGPFPIAQSLSAVRRILTNRYPDPEAGTLKKQLSRSLGIKAETLLQGNGSDELIYYLIATFGGPVVYPVPTFSMYGIISKALGEEKIEIPLDTDFDLDLDAMLHAIRQHRPKLVFLSTPNNPTGNCFSAEKVLKIIEASKGLVVVDEAYQPFASEKGFLPLLADYRNLVIMRTLSKIGLAALRFGFLIADPEIISEVNKVRLPFNVNALSQAAAIAALKEKKGLIKNIRTVVSERERLFDEMLKIPSIRPYPSEANFILFRVKNPSAVYEGLLKKGVLVRDLNTVVPGCLRVTIGTSLENKEFIRALHAVLKRSAS